MPIDLLQLRCLAALHRLGRVQRAAEALCMHTEDVQETLDRLQAALGVRLVTRHHRFTGLTPAGRISASAQKRRENWPVHAPGRSHRRSVFHAGARGPAQLLAVSKRLRMGSARRPNRIRARQPVHLAAFRQILNGPAAAQRAHQ